MKLRCARARARECIIINDFRQYVLAIAPSRLRLLLVFFLLSCMTDIWYSPLFILAIFVFGNRCTCIRGALIPPDVPAIDDDFFLFHYFIVYRWVVVDRNDERNSLTLSLHSQFNQIIFIWETVSCLLLIHCFSPRAHPHAPRLASTVIGIFRLSARTLFAPNSATIRKLTCSFSHSTRRCDKNGLRGSWCAPPHTNDNKIINILVLFSRTLVCLIPLTFSLGCLFVWLSISTSLSVSLNLYLPGNVVECHSIDHQPVRHFRNGIRCNNSIDSDSFTLTNRGTLVFIVVCDFFLLSNVDRMNGLRLTWQVPFASSILFLFWFACCLCVCSHWCCRRRRCCFWYFIFSRLPAIPLIIVTASFRFILNLFHLDSSA